MTDEEKMAHKIALKALENQAKAEELMESSTIDGMKYLRPDGSWVTIKVNPQPPKETP